MTRPQTIVVGAGSVGCLVAMRLARDFSQRVLLCETADTVTSGRSATAMSSARDDSQRPARWLRLLGSADDYRFVTEPSASLAGRSLVWPRGRGLGGSSRINAMIWHEPTVVDREMIDRSSGRAIPTATLQAAVREVENLVRPETPRWLSPIAEAFLAAMKTHRASESETIVAYRRFNRQGQRWTAESLLHSVPTASVDSTGSIDIVRSAVDRVLWKGDRAIGVRLIGGSGTDVEDVFADGGVVLCAGSIATPMILVRSGIGPREALGKLNIPCRYEAEAVGRNLQDHLVMPIVYETDVRYQFTDCVSMRDLARWQVAGTGPLASNLAECGGLVADGRFQLHVTPTHYLKFPQASGESAMTIAVNVTRPHSRGTVHCVSADANAPAKIDTGYLNHPSDISDLVEGIFWVRDLVGRSELSRLAIRELIPGENRVEIGSLQKSITRYSQTLYHCVGTCAMSSDHGGVVDGNFRVRGTEKLWIADGSILSVITQANPSVTLMALGWIAARMIAMAS